MSSIMLSPGVLVRELDYSEYIAEASTCVVGIVGGARKGPLVPTLITSREQLIKTFGKPTLQDYGIYSALAVLENADKVYYQRVIHNGVKAFDGASVLFQGASPAQLAAMNKIGENTYLADAQGLAYYTATQGAAGDISPIGSTHGAFTGKYLGVYLGAAFAGGAPDGYMGIVFGGYRPMAQ